MEISQSKIQQILTKHNELMITYEKILEDLEAKKILDSEKLLLDNPSRYFKSKDIGLVEKSQLYLNYFSFHNRNEATLHQLKSILLFFIKRKKFSWLQEFTEKKRFWNPLVQYLIKTHIRRQLNTLHKLYIRELVTQNTQKNKNEIEELRSITTTLKDYTQELPNIKRLFTTFATILFGIITTAQFFGINSLIFDSITTQVNFVIIGITVIPIIMAYIISDIFVRSFRIKRCKFLNTSKSYPCYDLYFGQGKSIYENSVYKIEDDLYKKLGTKKKKPIEIPVDIIIQLSLPGISALFLATIVLLGIFVSIFTESITIPWDSMAIGLPVLLIMTYGLFFMPLIKYRRRKKNNLL